MSGIRKETFKKKKNMKKVILGLALIVAVASPVLGAKEAGEVAAKAIPMKKSVAKSAKMLTVNVEEMYKQYAKAIEAQEKFDEAAQNAQNEINTMIQSGMALGEAYKDFIAKANNPALTEDAKKKFQDEAGNKAREIEQKQMEIQQYQQQASQTLAQRRQSVMNLHMNDMKEVCSKIAKEKGADLVLNSTGILVMYASDDMDITEEATKQLNATK